MAENRSITVLVDQEAKALTVDQDGSGRALDNVTATQIAITGYVRGQVSLSVDPTSLSVVLQTYKPDSTLNEFGACSVSAKPPP